MEGATSVEPKCRSCKNVKAEFMKRKREVLSEKDGEEGGTDQAAGNTAG